MMKRNGVELMRKWEERRRMCGRWTKRSRRTFMRLLNEVRKREEELNVKENIQEAKSLCSGFFEGRCK
jgi:hypothetical protein